MDNNSIATKPFGKIGLKEVLLFTLKNSNGISVNITNYGGIITALNVPDKNGITKNIVLGYNNLNDYLKDTFYLGAIIGRYCNRIANGKFSLDNKEYLLAINNGSNHIHGGIKGFNQKVWDAKTIKGNEFVGLELSCLSKNMEEGYPGNLTVKVSYKLTNDNELQIAYFATTDKKTIINLTQHSYFNLSGNVKSEILNHNLKINADYFLPIDDASIPKGHLEPIKNTPFDFTTFHKIGNRINTKHEQLNLGAGYDHNWVLKKNNTTLKLAAIVYEEQSGRQMEVYTTKPGMQLYTGNFLSEYTPERKKTNFGRRSGLCLETQYFPNSPNEPTFPSATLLPGEEYNESTMFKFSTKNQ